MGLVIIQSDGPEIRSQKIPSQIPLGCDDFPPQFGTGVCTEKHGQGSGHHVLV